jgi:hypothetical protein
MNMHTASSVEMPTLTVNEPSKEPNAHFEEFWSLYPRKAGKPKAESSFRSLTKKDQQAAIAKLPSYSFSDDKQYIPYPATWLNQRRWEDEDAEKANEGFVL